MKTFLEWHLRILKGSQAEPDGNLALSWVIAGHNPDRIRWFSGYTFFSRYLGFLGEKSMRNPARILNFLVWILSGSDDLVGTGFFEESVVSSGKSSISLKDPDKIREGSGTEMSKIFIREAEGQTNHITRATLIWKRQELNGSYEQNFCPRLHAQIEHHETTFHHRWIKMQH